MSEEAKRENATEFPYRAASPEFFFLLQRIDRLDEKLAARMDHKEQKMEQRFSVIEGRLDGLEQKMEQRFSVIEGRLDGLDSKLSSARFWAIGVVIAILLSAGGTILTLILAR